MVRTFYTIPQSLVTNNSYRIGTELTCSSVLELVCTWFVFIIGSKNKVVQKVRQYVWRLKSSAYILKMPEPISMVLAYFNAVLSKILDTLFGIILNTSVNSTFIKFIIQSGAVWRKLKPQISLSMNVTGISRTMQSVKLLNIQGGPKKTAHYTLVHIFAKYWPIFIILSPTHSAGNLQ